MQKLQKKRKYKQSFCAHKRRGSRVDIWIGFSPDVTKRGHAKGQEDTAWVVETTFYHKNTRCQSAGGAPKVGEVVVVLGSYGRFSVVHQSRESYFKANPHAAPSSLSVSGDKALRCAISTCLLGVGSSGPAKVKDCSSQVILPGLGKPKTAHRLSIGDNLS